MPIVQRPARPERSRSNTTSSRGVTRTSHWTPARLKAVAMVGRFSGGSDEAPGPGRSDFPEPRTISPYRTGAAGGLGLPGEAPPRKGPATPPPKVAGRGDG